MNRWRIHHKITLTIEEAADLSNIGINIAFMRLFRETKGHIAYTIVETDDTLPENLAQYLRINKNIHDVMIVQL